MCHPTHEHTRSLLCDCRQLPRTRGKISFPDRFRAHSGAPTPWYVSIRIHLCGSSRTFCWSAGATAQMQPHLLPGSQKCCLLRSRCCQAHTLCYSLTHALAFHSLTHPPATLLAAVTSWTGTGLSAAHYWSYNCAKYAGRLVKSRSCRVMPLPVRRCCRGRIADQHWAITRVRHPPGRAFLATPVKPSLQPWCCCRKLARLPRARRSRNRFDSTAHRWRECVLGLTTTRTQTLLTSSPTVVV